jgi:subtilisin family serine protease/subtilisin-like proprotein convertase family protein
MKLLVGLLFLLVICVAWPIVDAGDYFELGRNPEQPRLLPNSLSVKQKNSRLPVIKRDVDLQQIEFKSSWVVEFNDLILSSLEDFKEYHNVHLRQIGKTNKFATRQKVASLGRDSKKEDSLRLDPRIRSIKFENPRPRFPRQIPTTDPGLCNQWHLWKCPTSSRDAASINVQPAWIKNFTGSGIQIAVVDDGVEYTHPDLSAGYVAADSYDFVDDDDDPMANIANGEVHGTACAGLAAAQTNTKCGVGAAYKATFSAIKLTVSDTTDSQEASALTYKPNNNDIYTNSWGPADDGQTVEGPGGLLLSAFTDSVNGRDGKGSIYVWAAGNGREQGDQSTKDGYTSNPNVIGVSAIGVTGKYASYSEPGASNFVCAPGGDSDGFLYTTDATSFYGYSGGDCTNAFAGTSGATPIVAGSIAMILEANPDLSARDVRRILGLTATKNDPQQTELPWFQNGAGHWMSYNYGFGLVNVDRAIAAAKMWPDALPAVVIQPAVVTSSEESITDNCYSIEKTLNVTIEYVSLYVDIQHTFRGDLRVNLTSPEGTTVVLLFADGQDANANYDWTFFTYFFLDEKAAGTWKFCVADLFDDEDSGTLKRYSLSVVGRPLEKNSLAVALESITPQLPVQGDVVEVVLSFSDEKGIFVESVDSMSILIGGMPTSIEILSTTAIKVVAKFSLNSTYLALGLNQIKTGQITVQNKWLYALQGDLLIGDFELFVPPEAPIAQQVPTSSSSPIATQTQAPGKVVSATSLIAFNFVLGLMSFMLCI